VFQELMPLLAQRVLVLTLSRTNSDEICVNVIPRPRTAGDKDENNALLTPLSISGTPTELDQELPKQLVEFVGAHLELSSSLRSAKEEMAAAAKLARDAARKSTAPKPGPSAAAAAKGTPTADPDLASKEDGKPAAEVSAAPVTPTPSLFEAAPKVE
jgi:PRTRC genetic system protein E